MYFQVIPSSQITFSISFFKYTCILCRSFLHTRFTSKSLCKTLGTSSRWEIVVPMQWVMTVLIEKYQMRSLKIAVAMRSLAATTQNGLWTIMPDGTWFLCNSFTGNDCSFVTHLTVHNDAACQAVSSICVRGSFISIINRKRKNRAAVLQRVPLQ